MQLAPAPRAIDPMPELMTVYARVPGRVPADLPSLVAKILELLDGARRTDEVFEAAQISAEKGLAVVRKLSRLGIIETAPAPRARRATAAPLSDPEALERAETLRGLSPISPRGAGFSAAEEAFFASEVEPTLDPEEEPSGLRHRLSLVISDLVLYLRRDVAL
jgi:hypothetical protein